MYIPSHSFSASNTPLSSRLIQTAGEKAQQNVISALDEPNLITPEVVNRTIRSGEQQLQQKQDQREAQQQAKREALVNLNHLQHQQQMIETYVRVYSGESIDLSRSLTPTELIERVQQHHEKSPELDFRSLRDKLPQRTSIQPVTEQLQVYQDNASTSEQRLGLSLQA